MIYEYSNPALLIDAALFDYIPHPISGATFLFIAIFLFVGISLSSLFSEQFSVTLLKEKGDTIKKYTSVFFYTGFFIYWYAINDEVAVNLEHVYNLHNHGLFSMSPTSVLDGTIEFVFYLLHYPFSSTPALTVFGNFIVSYSVGCALLLIITNWLHAKKHPLALEFSILLAIAWPLTGAAATGFGNGLGAIVYALVIINILDKKFVTAMFISALLPLIRPDGFAWAGLAGLIVLGLSWREILRASAKKKALVLASFVSPVVAVGAYWTAFSVYYGQWHSTPMEFKSLSSSRLASINPDEVFKTIRGYGEDPTILALLGIAALGLIVYFVRQRKVVGSESEMATVPVFLVAAMFPIVLFSIAGASQGWFGNTAFRYWMGATLLIFFATMTVTQLAIRERHRWLKIAAPVLVLTIVSATWSKYPERADSIFTNRNWAADAGLLVSKITDNTELTVATTEMNTFGLAVEDRHVQDFWGYSNREFAASELCTQQRTRVDPNAFLAASPDIFWIFWVTHHPEEFRWGFEDLDQVFYIKTEQMFASKDHVHQGQDRLGNLTDTIQHYNFVRLRAGELRITVLSHRDSFEIFETKLEELGFVKTKQRPISMERIQKNYEQENSGLISC